MKFLIVMLVVLTGCDVCALKDDRKLTVYWADGTKETYRGNFYECPDHIEIVYATKSKREVVYMDSLHHLWKPDSVNTDSTLFRYTLNYTEMIDGILPKAQMRRYEMRKIR